jgi:hypothetical protein
MHRKIPGNWPAYPTGPKDSIFAMGVISIKFAELESIITFLFATTLGLDLDEATKVVSQIGTRTCLRLMSAKLCASEWPQSTTDLVEWFVKGASICTNNRNHLMHSVLAWTAGEHTILYKTSRQGKTIVAVPMLSELRCVADDMEAFINYGRQLGNAINNSSFEIPIFPNTPGSAFAWPNKPREPIPLKFSSEPQTLREA